MSKNLMRLPTGKTVIVILSAIAVTLLTGCVAVALAPLAGMANGARENAILVTVDEKTFTPEVRSALRSAKSLAIVAGDRSAIKAADLFESRGGYVVSIDRPSAKVGEMTGSERRETLKKLCASVRPDVSMLGRTERTETGNMMVGALTGRAKVKNDWVMDILVCRTQTTMSFGGTFEIDVGVYNQKANSEYEELIGTEIGSKILDAIGKGSSGQVAGVAPTAEQNSVAESASKVSKVAAINETAKSEKSDASANTFSPMDIQKKLIDLGFLAGKADGVMGKNSIEALKKFQQANGLAVTGKPDSETVARLRVAKAKN